MKYNMEKVLYFANRESGIHVGTTEEPRSTTLWGLLTEALSKEWLQLSGRDDSGTYYHTTETGTVELHRLQALWRKRNRK